MILKNTKEYQYGLNVSTHINEDGKRIIKALSVDESFVEIDLMSLLSDVSKTFPDFYNSFCKIEKYIDEN